MMLRTRCSCFSPRVKSETPRWSTWGLQTDGRCDCCRQFTDKRVIVSGDSNYGIGFHEAEYNRPREWGIAGRLNF